ncbi:hypothetical protein J6590_055726 [Homalodisca vitripennis]|nr:hypothetical protein J6590_055726 [Homalodisca vitripennis]
MEAIRRFSTGFLAGIGLTGGSGARHSACAHGPARSEREGPLESDVIRAVTLSGDLLDHGIVAGGGSGYGHVNRRATSRDRGRFPTLRSVTVSRSSLALSADSARPNRGLTPWTGSNYVDETREGKMKLKVRAVFFINGLHTEGVHGTRLGTGNLTK